MSQPRQQTRPAGSTLLIAGATAGIGYALSGQAGEWLAVRAGSAQVPVLALYAAAAAMVLAQFAPLAVRSSPAWSTATAVALRGISISLALFALLRLLPDLGQPSTPLAIVNDGAAFADRYMEPMRALSIAVLVAGIGLSLYRASFPLWRPIPDSAIVQAFVASIAAQYVFDPHGPVTVRTGLDLSYFAWPVWSVSAGYAAFWMVRLARVNRIAHTVAAAVLWGSLAVAGYLVFHYLDHFAAELVVSERYQALGERALPYLTVVAALDHWIAAGIAILGLERSMSGYSSHWHGRQLGPLIEAARSLALGVLVWGASQELRAVGALAEIAGVVAFSACAAVAVGRAARLLSAPRFSAAVASAGGWLAGSQFRNANIGGIVALYATVLRPALYETTSFAPLIEWLGLALPVAYLIARASAGVARETGNPPKPAAWHEWRLHQQNANPFPDGALTRAAAVREGFLDTGSSAGIAVRVITAMTIASRPIDEVVPAIRPLIELRTPEGDRSGAAGFFRTGSAAARAKAVRAQSADATEAAMRASVEGALLRKQQGLDAAAVWAEARQAFIERGDRVRLGIAATMVGWSAGATRQVLIMQFGRIVQYRDAKPRWYDLPSVRRRTVERAPIARTGFADQLRPSGAATGVRSQ